MNSAHLVPGLSGEARHVNTSALWARNNPIADGGREGGRKGRIIEYQRESYSQASHFMVLFRIYAF